MNERFESKLLMNYWAYFSLKWKIFWKRINMNEWMNEYTKRRKLITNMICGALYKDE